MSRRQKDDNPDNSKHRPRKDTTGSAMFKDKNGNRTVGFCLWCNKDFYNLKEAKAHHANDSKDCPVFQQLRGQHYMPPVLQMMFENAGLMDEDNDSEPRSKE
jgi:hypothetical protein